MRHDSLLEHSAKPLRILVSAAIQPDSAGGVAQYVEELAAEWGQTPSNVELVWHVLPGHRSWLNSRLGVKSNIIEEDPARWKHKQFGSRFVPSSQVHLPDGSRLVESVSPDLVFFPTQNGFLSSVTSVYQPHDLQHLHFPEFFSRGDRRIREVAFRVYMKQAKAIVAGSQWTADDICFWFPNFAKKIRVIKYAATGLIEAYPQEIAGFAKKHPLILYPANFWPHKNHKTLLQAIAVLAQSGVRVELALPGNPDGSNEVRRQSKDLRIEQQTHFLGRVTPNELAWLYSQADVVVNPSMFENGSFSIYEAFQLGVPVVASTAGGIPEQVGDAALLCSPEDVPGFARAIASVIGSDSLRRQLVSAGRSQMLNKNWASTIHELLRIFSETVVTSPAGSHRRE